MYGEKIYVKCSKVIIAKVSQYYRLRVRELIKIAEKEFEIHKFLPDYDYHKESNRDWVCNVINIVILNKINEFINEKIKENNK